jgi:hypothetical protein
LKPALIDLEENIFIYYMMIELKGILFCNKEVLKIPRAGAAFTSWDHIKSNGIVSRQSILEANEPCLLDNWLYKLAELQRLQYADSTKTRGL